MGCVLIRHGGRHDWYQNPETGESQPVPRHVEINEHLATNILKKLSYTGRISIFGWKSALTLCRFV